MPHPPSTSASHRLIVHEAHRPPAPTLRYIDQVVGGERDDVEFRFSQSVLTRFDIDVLHVTDSSLDMLVGPPATRGFPRLLASFALIHNLRRHVIALVRTIDVSTAEVHRHWAERVAHRLLDRATDMFIVLDEHTSTPFPRRTTLIPHSHMRERFVGYPRGTQVHGRLLYAPTRALQDAVNLLALPRLTRTMEVSLRLVGTASDSVGTAVRSSVARYAPMISMRLENISDGARVQEIDNAELVVVPRTESLDDLQTVFLALSRERPVLTPRTPMMARLAIHVGKGWMQLSEGPITADAVDTAFSAVRDPNRSMRPNLEGRDIDTTRMHYIDAFRRAFARRSNTKFSTFTRNRH